MLGATHINNHVRVVGICFVLLLAMAYAREVRGVKQLIGMIERRSLAMAWFPGVESFNMWFPAGCC